MQRCSLKRFPSLNYLVLRRSHSRGVAAVAGSHLLLHRRRRHDSCYCIGLDRLLHLLPHQGFSSNNHPVLLLYVGGGRERRYIGEEGKEDGPKRGYCDMTADFLRRARLQN